MVARGTKAEQTRAAVLEAAEQIFARRGYAATRLEDVADAVGVTRAALFYHFRDKQALYDAMVENAFEPLAVRLEGVFSSTVPIAQRIENAVEAWVDAIIARPTLARLILRHAADAEELPTKSVSPATERYLKIGWSLFEEGSKSGEFRPVQDSPFHAASTVIGATVFYASALAPLHPPGNFDPLAPEQAAIHKSDMLRVSRLLLGIAPEPKPRQRMPRPKSRPQQRTSKR